MNLWVKRIGQLMMVAALFFVSCVEESTLLGFRAKSRFTVLYKELPIESSIFLIDSLNTTNYGSGDRFLVGKYADDALGEVSATAFSQFRPGSLPDSLATSELDSVSLRLRFDYYNYGSGDKTPQKISIYELADTLTAASATNLPYYYADSDIPRGVKVGEKTFEIDPVIFNEYRDAPTANPPTTPPTTVLKMQLYKTFGEPIFQSAVDYETTKDDPIKANRDTTFIHYSLFVKQFKGLAIVSESGDKILGFNPVAAETKMVLHFHKSNNKPDSIVLRLTNVASFNQILSNRSGTDVAEVLEDQEYAEVQPPSDYRYIENGVGIVSKLDLGSFLQFVDTIPAMSINSAEILVNDVPVQSSFQRPQLGLGIRVLYDNNHFRSDVSETNASDISLYKGTVSYGSAQSPVPNGYVNGERTGEPLTIPWVSTDTEKKYNGFTTLFAQELYRNYKSGGPVFSKLALYSLSPNAGKNVDRVSFHKDNVKLRIYYTIPTIETAE